ncbi:DUF2169 family type VI secretion system accessory protein [Cereibacter sphaeroides]|uniref:DUF2169 family type VI secretion system accessory protein n=1 Tax=Cereibacter sphaeroides TaxID=1063 RepID=UPI001F442D67|nr:DUF2169 domain-containing protein [Cereibacter sphaeroides]MCE6968725.1 DUF2169 domain-containing protein [Cereibacter sphaeroides]
MQFENESPFPALFTMGLDRSGHETVVVTVKGTFDLTPDPARSERQEPLILSDVFGPDPATDAPLFENDFAPFKPFCDVLCHGPAVTPGQRPALSLTVGLRVGGWSKVISVHGRRIWLKNGLGHRVSDARPFVRQPIGYDEAWGGTDPEPDDPTRAATCEENPVGLGYYPHRADLEGAALPVTAEAGQIVSDRSGPHRPMAFGPLGRGWLPRRRFAGTYDQAWLDHRMPFLPDDFDDRFHQSAPPDQQIPYPRGGEPVELVGFSVEGRIRSRLPHDRILVTFGRKAGPVTRKIANPDTVLILPESRRFCITWRSRFVTARDLHEIAGITVRREEVPP